MIIRKITESDYLPVITALDEWWGGRKMADMLPRLFFKHFKNTSYIAEETGNILGFLVGFISQTQTEQAYIHFVGIHPDHRGSKIASRLYQEFFTAVRGKGCNTVQLVTSPQNRNSIAFHTKMGFEMEKSDQHKDGAWIFADYDGPGQDRVVFAKQL